MCLTAWLKQKIGGRMWPLEWNQAESLAPCVLTQWQNILFYSLPFIHVELEELLFVYFVLWDGGTDFGRQRNYKIVSQLLSLLTITTLTQWALRVIWREQQRTSELLCHLLLCTEAAPVCKYVEWEHMLVCTGKLERNESPGTTVLVQFWRNLRAEWLSC